MDYIPPFQTIKQKVRITGTNGKTKVEMRYAEFIDLLKLILRAAPVNEEWYLARYPDVAQAIKGGLYKSAKHHFIEEGYFEGRTPCDFSVDENWYLTAYPDIAAGIKSGSIGSGKEHFMSHGYQEGRLPSEF